MKAQTQQEMVRFSMPGRVYGELRLASNWPNDCPKGWAAIQASPVRKAGRGTSRAVEMDREDALDLGWYLAGYAQAAASAASDDGGERGGWQMRMVRRIEAATGETVSR